MEKSWVQTSLGKPRLEILEAGSREGDIVEAAVWQFNSDGFGVVASLC